MSAGPPQSDADPTAAPALEVTGVHKAFGAHPVLRGVELTVPAGAFAAVLGPSGSGKTTLLRILAGFERPDAGTVRISSTEVDAGRRHVPPERRSIGYVAQEGSLFPHLSVAANVGFGMPRKRRKGPRTGELLDAVGLGGLGHRYPHQLSGGQQQRVALARALAVAPRLVLLDEPFAALDAGLRAEVRADVVAILRDAGTAAVLVTHDQDEALSTADLVAVIRGGIIAQAAAPEEIYANPADADLARFVGAGNVLRGERRARTVATTLGALVLRDPTGAADGALDVLVRPEQVELDATTGPAGTVVARDFHGHDLVLRVALDGPGDAAVVARVAGDHPAVVGERVTVGVRGAVTAWPGTGGS